MRLERVQKGVALSPLRAACLTLAASAFAAVSLSAQLPPPARPPKPAADVAPPKRAESGDLPDARRIVDRHIDAIGGRDAVLAQSSMHVTGTVGIPSAGLTGTFELFAKKPNRMLVKMTISGVGETVEGYNGTVGWEISPMTGPSLLEGKQLAEKAFDADYYEELHHESRYESMQTVERTTFDGRACYKVRFVRKGGGEDVEFYDATTGLKAGTTATRVTSMGPMSLTGVESEYRRFGKLLHPTKVSVTTMGLQQVMTVAAVEYDTVPDSVFEPPAVIKALLK
jgi:hypothetical protein